MACHDNLDVGYVGWGGGTNKVCQDMLSGSVQWHDTQILRLAFSGSQVCLKH